MGPLMLPQPPKAPLPPLEPRARSTNGSWDRGPLFGPVSPLFSPVRPRLLLLETVPPLWSSFRFLLLPKWV